MNENLFEFIQVWYLSKCDGKWEHQYGMNITTLDNPGWKVSINGETNRKAINQKNENNDDDWLSIIANDTEFRGYGDPEKLQEILMHAKTWLES